MSTRKEMLASPALNGIEFWAPSAPKRNED